MVPSEVTYELDGIMVLNEELSDEIDVAELTEEMIEVEGVGGVLESSLDKLGLPEHE